MKEYEELIARRSAIEEGYAQLTEAKKLNDKLNQKLGLLVKLNEHKSQLEKAIEKAGAALITDHAVAQSKIEELEADSQKLPQLKDSGISLISGRYLLRMITFSNHFLLTSRSRGR